MTNASLAAGAVGSASASVGTPEDATPARRPTAPLSELQWRILALLAREKVNAWSAYERLRVSCLRTHVSHLEKKGVFICREWFAMPTRHGKTVPAVRYWIEPGEWARLTSAPRERAVGAA